MLNEYQVAVILRRIRQEHGGRPWLRIGFDDRRVDWSRLGTCTNHGLPAISQGQACDCRWSLDNQESLHAHWHPTRGVVDFHLDRWDPVHSPIAHLAIDTYIPHGIGIGGLILAPLGLWGAVAGAIIGACAGAAISSRASGIWTLTKYRSADDWVAERLDSAHHPGDAWA
jgi:hypothetical protein